MPDDKIDYDLIKLEHQARDVVFNKDYLEIKGLDGSFTKIHKNYIPEKYILKDNDNIEE